MATAVEFPRVVERGTAGVAVSPENLSHGVAEPQPPASRSAPEIAGILMQKRRVDRFGHIVADDEVSIGCADISTESSRALPKGAILVHQLALAAKQNCQADSSTIEGIFGSDLELLSGRQGHIILEGRRGPVVWNDSKKSFGLGLLRITISRLSGGLLTQTHARTKNETEAGGKNSTGDIPH
jgi:hypothetical protein